MSEYKDPRAECILSFDPGGTTGWASVTIRELKSGDAEFMWHTGQLLDDNHHSALYSFMCNAYDDNALYNDEPIAALTIVTESFEYRNISRAGLRLDSVEYIGVMKLFCDVRDVELKFQTASMGKVRDKPGAFVKPDNIKKLDLWSPGSKHAMDALGHLLYYMINSDKRYAKQLLERGWK